jgi:putative membrane protein (TIGR04086 family)
MIPLSTNTNQILSLILILSYIFIFSIKKGINTEEKAYINGIKQGLLYTVILYIAGLPLLIYKLSIKRLIYFLIIIIITILGNIIGINKKTLK